jgi:addiction module HigA family antidote
MARKRKPTTPGDILKHEFMEPLQLTAYRVAKETGLQPIHISEIIKGKRRITAETSLLLSKYLGTSATYWMDLQTGHDLRVAERDIADRLEAVVPVQKQKV